MHNAPAITRAEVNPAARTSTNSTIEPIGNAPCIASADSPMIRPIMADGVCSWIKVRSNAIVTPPMAPHPRMMASDNG